MRPAELALSPFGQIAPYKVMGEERGGNRQEQWASFFREDPLVLLPGVRLVLIPTGSHLEGWGLAVRVSGVFSGPSCPLDW